MDIHTPGVPGHLRVTDGMIEDLYWDPVMAAKVLLGLDLDYFQEVRLRLYWFVPKLIDSSGFSSGKTIVDWAYMQLRCLLLPEHDAGVYYPTFQTGKNTFWPYYSKISTPIFRAHMGRLDEKGDEDGSNRVQGAACYTAYYKNGGTLKMPAPSFLNDARTQASLRFNTLLVEEWTHIDAMGDGIDAQLIGRVTKPSRNQHHPIWGNHIHLTAPAKSRSHPGYARYNNYLKKVAKGDPSYALVQFSYKDYSSKPTRSGKTCRDEFRVDSTILEMKSKKARADFLGEGLGIWASSGKGWFTEEAIARCVAAGVARGVAPMTRA